MSSSWSVSFLIYQLLLPFSFLLLNSAGVWIGTLLWGRTKGKGPLLFFLGSSGGVLTGLAMIVMAFLSLRGFHPYYQTVWLAIAGGNVISFALQIAGVLFIDTEFRGLLERVRLLEQTQQAPSAR